MKKVINQPTIYLTQIWGLLLCLGLMLPSCEKKDFQYVQPEPKASLVDANATGRRQIPTGRIRFDVNLQAAAGLKAVVLKTNGVEIKREDLLPLDEFFLTYNVDFTVPANAQQGNRIALTVEAIDRQERTSAPVTYTVDVVGSTFTITDVNVAGQTMQQITGILNVDYEIPANGRVLLNGRVEVEEGITLAIRPGAILYAKTGLTTPSYLSIRPKGIIRALGTKDAPIVMTSERVLTNNAAAGDWGGLVINGQARVNTPDFTATGVTGRYGGTVDNDNSGTLEYVRVEFGGGGVGSDALEPANITLNGVGSATTIRFVQSFNSGALGFYINGGQVNLRNVVSMNSPSHEFYAERGWRGLGQFWVAHTTRPGDRGIQVSTFSTTQQSFVVSECTISNVTLVGPGFAQPAPTFENIGIRLRRAARARIFNALVTQYPSSGVRLDADANTEYLSGQALLAHSNVFLNSAAPTHSNNFHSSTRSEWRDKPANNNLTTTVPLTQNFVGTSTTAPLNPTTLGTFFTAANYRGAVPTNADWTADGTWCKNADGTIR
ncbi:MAG: hypothetical protein ACK4GN_03170 [Runella sp.]